MTPMTPLRQWPLIRSQMVRGHRFLWHRYHIIIRIARRLRLQVHAFPIHTQHETALDRQKILRRKYQLPNLLGE